MTKTKIPPASHPGELLRELLDSLAISVSEASAEIGVARPTLSRLLNGHASISPDMALRLEAWLRDRDGPEALAWLTRQVAYDLAQAREAYAGDVEPLRRSA